MQRHGGKDLPDSRLQNFHSRVQTQVPDATPMSHSNYSLNGRQGAASGPVWGPRFGPLKSFIGSRGEPQIPTSSRFRMIILGLFYCLQELTIVQGWHVVDDFARG